ncbi:Protein of unknown function [Saccharopolyspora antimicrobica]|uniref:Uncharacterized protein DUF2871 n=1 Tax=Saccharopolyspora antimicrobica TaxID=455193 RepID=A0A1I5KCX0_9PSEU|nr:DUF2871 domain-containing protein [Saccharopolyspora antimicrobica]RKT81953.1 uncharacterized protein DUF2871 [Saccharopolyspora antimicrobica]SFO82857.1 Protein of unknown function [Saccharopolyspora antimicrobica]
MKKVYWAALSYMVLGLAAGLYYRELTKAQEFTGDTQLAVAHTHLLALGMLFFLVVLALDKAFGLSGNRLFTLFFWFYNSGLALTAAMMLVHGTMTVLGAESSAAISGIAGLGHILITVGLVHLFLALRKALPARAEAR